MRSCRCSLAFLASWSSIFSRSSREADVSSSRIASPARTTSPGRFSTFFTRASTGLEITASNAGMTDPEASTIPSTGPRSTVPRPDLLPATEGRSHPGSSTSTTTTAATRRPPQPPGAPGGDICNWHPARDPCCSPSVGERRGKGYARS